MRRLGSGEPLRQVPCRPECWFWQISSVGCPDRRIGAGVRFNLNISRYVDTTVVEEVMSVEEALAQLREAELKRDDSVAKIDAVLAEMGYSRQ